MAFREPTRGEIEYMRHLGRSDIANRTFGDSAADRPSDWYGSERTQQRARNNQPSATPIAPPVSPQRIRQNKPLSPATRKLIETLMEHAGSAGFGLGPMPTFKPLGPMPWETNPVSSWPKMSDWGNRLPLAIRHSHNGITQPAMQGLSNYGAAGEVPKHLRVLQPGAFRNTLFKMLGLS